jgi:hypothetical protein
MTDPQVALMMLGVFIFIILLGFPIAFTLMAMGIGFGYYAYFDADRMWRSYHRAVEQGADMSTQWLTWIEGFFNNRIFDLFVNQTFSVMANDVLTAVPLFLFMGYSELRLQCGCDSGEKLPVQVIQGGEQDERTHGQPSPPRGRFGCWEGYCRRRRVQRCQ